MPDRPSHPAPKASSAAPIVVAEDDPNIADLLDLYLRQAGYRPFLAGDGARALELISSERPKLVILDIGLPGDLDGFGVCRQVREASDVPILILTARDDEIDRVLGLELGADDYVTKPFSPREVVARVKAILRRTDGPGRADDPDAYEVGGVRVDGNSRTVTLDGEPVALAGQEFELLRYLCENRGLALSRRQLLDGAWGAEWVGDDRTVDVHIRQLRKKLGDGLTLSTVWGVGYRLD